MLPPVRVPVRPTVVSRSKQFEPLTCTAPLTELPDTLILPAIVRGGVPGTVDVVLNCQLLTALTPGGFEVGPEVGLEGEPGVLPPPHPHSSTRTESSQEKLDGSLVASFIIPPPVSLESVTSSVATQNATPCSGVKSVHPHDPACKAEAAPPEEDSQAAPDRALPGFTPNQHALLFRKSETAGKRRQECPKNLLGPRTPARLTSGPFRRVSTSRNYFIRNELSRQIALRTRSLDCSPDAPHPLTRVAVGLFEKRRNRHGIQLGNDLGRDWDQS